MLRPSNFELSIQYNVYMSWFRSLCDNVLIDLVIFNDERMQKLFKHIGRLVSEMRDIFEKIYFLIHLPQFKLP